jgi:RNA 3'-terminal phosphate cyclase
MQATGANGRPPSHENEDGSRRVEQWTAAEATAFYTSFHKHGQSWKVVAKAVGSKSADACEDLLRQHAPYLRLDKHLQDAQIFVAMAVGNGAVRPLSRTLSLPAKKYHDLACVISPSRIARQKDKALSMPPHTFSSFTM